MGILNFIKEAGEKLFATDAKADPAPPEGVDVDAANRTAAEAIETYIRSMNLDATGLTVTFDGASRTVTVFGVAPDQETKEKIVLCCGNVKGVEAVEDKLSVSTASAESQYHTVESGDTLWKVAEKAYGNGSQYPDIFEANKPMLSDPDKIYPGQVLRIPAV
ncbi:peptidoglycan-binding protein LysM [Pandoraea terrae]|uniref:Potassium binding protein Kbp n=1 Tax=Pandoraea terrae TaxID=1537710 RepID=A0A5E4WQZ8_9BURK|nr:peptidoglycan-binding protein LysM [Pandoraea terrae]VVE25375.1 peptidoglycan-binding protein LysM [Pandoraea terrae]